MGPDFAIDIGREALIITLIISGPILIAGLFVGLLIGLFQAVTQIHEMTLTFIPKILVMVGVFLLLLPWMMVELMDYTIRLFNMIPTVMK
ncbi:MAG: flagellar biosynthesis protein FliQ [Chitinispirillaceae bacterium]|nr:flagellar biosynthesis protein FliQ [Chitinispirillaceae bacterium]